MVLKCIMYFQAIAGGANEELSRQGKDWNMRQKNNESTKERKKKKINNGLVARCHSLCLSL
jgi:hypothetical protein